MRRTPSRDPVHFASARADDLPDHVLAPGRECARLHDNMAMHRSPLHGLGEPDRIGIGDTHRISMNFILMISLTMVCGTFVLFCMGNMG